MPRSKCAQVAAQILHVVTDTNQLPLPAGVVIINVITLFLVRSLNLAFGGRC